MISISFKFFQILFNSSSATNWIIEIWKCILKNCWYGNSGFWGLPLVCTSKEKTYYLEWTTLGCLSLNSKFCQISVIVQRENVPIVWNYPLVMYCCHGDKTPFFYFVTILQKYRHVSICMPIFTAIFQSWQQQCYFDFNSSIPKASIDCVLNIMH